jgi:cardiolipin synthase
LDAPPTEHVALLRDGVEAFPAMLDAVAGARHEVLVEMYWFDDTPVARRFLATLTDRAREGVAVRVSYDAVGSIGSDGARFDALVAAGGKVIEYNPIAPWRRRFRLGWVSQRDHRKIVVVDGRVGFIGGLNIGAPWAPRDEGGGGWRDDVARVEGVGAQQLRKLFYDTWCRQSGDCPPDISPASGWGRLVEARKASGVALAANPEIVVLGHDAWGARRVIRRVYLQRIRAAERRVYIANSYFIPDGAVCRALERAARRGVEVRVIVPRVSDVPVVTWAARHLYARLMKAGVHVHEYLGRVFHAKTALVDDWATTGSYNLDSLSWRSNLEANMATSDPGFVRSVQTSLARDLADSEEVDPVVWGRRTWADRLRSWAWYLFRKFL